MHQVSERDKLNIVFGKDEFDPEKTFGNFEGVAAEIERRTISRVGNTKNVSDKPIVLENRDIENSVIQDPAFLDVSIRLGIKQLRNFISQLLAHRMEDIMPELRQKANEDMNRAKEGLKEHGRFDNVDKDDLISKLVEISMERIRTNLYGLSTNVAMEAEATGAQMNILIKDGALSASQDARRTYSIQCG